MAETERGYKEELKEKTLLYEKESNELTEKHKQELESAINRYQEFRKGHEQEVKDTFENINTLKFVKEMRFFKKEWEEQKTEKTRKKIAAAIANTTKSWVSDNEKISE